MSENPLVSICITFFGAEKYIRRVLYSCLNQTYRNIEVVIVDDVSIDGSEEIIKEYAKRDPRIKYFRNTERERFMLGLAKAFKLAKGDFVMFIGADDWLSRDYIENGVRSFKEHPDAAGIVPRMIGLFEVDSNKFKFRNEIFGNFSPPKIYSAEWFAKRAYKGIDANVGALALTRKEDAVSAADYFIENYYNNPSDSIPEELKKSFLRGFSSDAMSFLEILTRYKSFVFDSSLNHFHTTGGQTQHFEGIEGRESLSEIFKQAHYYTIIFKYIYEPRWTRFYRKMKIFLASEALSSVFIYFLRSGLRPYFLNIRGG
jgi:glycosyltransferase involved in cell wall biosynthesis